MKVDSAQIDLFSQRSLEKTQRISESLVEGIIRPGSAWSPDNLSEGVIYSREQISRSAAQDIEINLTRLAKDAAGGGMPAVDRLRQLARDIGGRAPDPQQSALDLSARQQPMMPQLGLGQNQGAEPSALNDIDETLSLGDAKLLLLKAMIEALSGNEIKIFMPSDMQPDGVTPMEPPVAEDATTTADGANPEWGMRYRYSETYIETERTQFSATGSIKTADGREISIDLELTMSRRFASQMSINIDAGAALKDPLVINFNGTAAQLTQTKFSFDIDADGSDDQIAFVGPNSGLLALDRNGDGTVNDGRELFGALSGDGFADLAAYDDDGNGFIDEADGIYQQLRVWTKDAEGHDQLLTLGEANVGAIYLQSTATPFDIRNSDNELLAVIRASGIYLGEDGRVGSVQQLDLAV
ncbi:MAG TPA: hypothetical protein ENI80_09230 [Acidiferrobacteraceae bacterium]|nr:hypothetical protein [Acidiferrobacteraceae bacterium]